MFLLKATLKNTMGKESLTWHGDWYRVMGSRGLKKLKLEIDKPCNHY
jgi:hypothetical protein